MLQSSGLYWKRAAALVILLIVDCVSSREIFSFNCLIRLKCLFNDSYVNHLLIVKFIAVHAVFKSLSYVYSGARRI